MAYSIGATNTLALTNYTGTPLAVGTLTGVQAGSAIVLLVREDGSRTLTISDDRGNSYVSKGNKTQSYNFQAFVAENVAAGDTIISIAPNSNVNNVGAVVAEIRGLVSGATSLDVAGTLAFTASATSVDASATTTFDPDVLIGVAFSESINRPLTVPTSFNKSAELVTGTKHLMISDMLQTGGSGTKTVTFPVSGGSAVIDAVLLAFKVAAAAGGTPHSFHRRKAGGY